MHGEEANAKACAKVLVRQWVTEWGVLDIITSDRESQLVSELLLYVWRLLGITRDPTTNYHPEHNGLQRSTDSWHHKKLVHRTPMARETTGPRDIKEMHARVDKVPRSLEPKYTGPFGLCAIRVSLSKYASNTKITDYVRFAGWTPIIRQAKLP